MGLTKEQREKRTKLVVMAKRGEGNEAEVAAAKVEEFDARIAAEEPKHRTWGDGKGKKAAPEPVVTEEEKALVTVGPLQQALAAATAAGDISALKDVASMAAALRAGAKARGMGIVSENQAAEVVVRAERALGATLIRMADEGARQPRGSVHGRLGGGSLSPTETNIPTIEELTGVSRNVSAKWQALARLPEDEFEALLAEKREANERIARVDFLRAATPVEPHQTPIAKQARREVMEALHADDDIPQVVAWLAATDALVALTDALPTAELAAIGTKAKALVEWYNGQKQQRS